MKEPIKVPNPEIKYLLNDYLVYLQYLRMGYPERTFLMEELKESLNETIKVIGN